MKIIIIGSNAAGMSFAAKYKRNNPTHEIIAFEKRDYVSFGSCGLPYFAGGFFDDETEFFARTVEDTIKSGIDLRINTEIREVNFIDKYVLVNDEKIGYDKLVISTGARPIIPNFGKYNANNFHTLTTLNDGKEVKEKLSSDKIKHVTIIGAGFIGLELVEACLQMNKKVTLIEAQDQIMKNQFDNEITQYACEHLKEEHIDLKLDTQVQQINDTENGYKVSTSNGELDTDLILCCVGFRPNTEYFDLDKLTNGAIVVDEYCQTSIKDVYAIGDCATSMNLVTRLQSYTPLATVANKYGRMLADHLSNKEVFLDGMIDSSCLKLIDLDMARTGLGEKQLLDANISYGKKVIVDKNHTSYYPGQSKVVMVIYYDLETYVILGGQMIGQSEIVGRINTLACAVTMKMTTKQLGYLDLCYAPPYSRTWDILNVAGNIIK